MTWTLSRKFTSIRGKTQIYFFKNYMYFLVICLYFSTKEGSIFTKKVFLLLAHSLARCKIEQQISASLWTSHVELFMVIVTYTCMNECWKAHQLLPDILFLENKLIFHFGLFFCQTDWCLSISLHTDIFKKSVLFLLERTTTQNKHLSKEYNLNKSKSWCPELPQVSGCV